ncbi:MAG: phosphopentomutase [Candidatus Gastranaerophilales bacterium]|nr:phosphopentomutase [Candidatus Gastranaerophilales bacterium]
MNKKRAIVIVIDSMGCGALPDANEYGDDLTCNTLANLANAADGLNVPNLEKMGFGNIIDIKGVQKTSTPSADYGILKMKSKGKDTTTGHWELMGLVLENPFKTYKKFDDKLINEFIKRTNCGGILGNKPASGTAIIEELNKIHHQTKFPIIYTSADSVFQIALDIDLIPVETLYQWCKTAREILDEYNYGISRVIARPYQVIDGKPTRIGGLRHDYSVEPPSDTLLNYLEKNGKKTLGIGKIYDIFVGSGVSEKILTKGNTDGLNKTLEAISNSSADLIFTNLVDTDMLYGHRRDSLGYKKAIEEIDSYIPKFIEKMTDDDMLIITADHGCDPTHKGTDHTREQVPYLMFKKGLVGQNIGIKENFCFVSDEIKKHLM